MEKNNYVKFAGLGIVFILFIYLFSNTFCDDKKDSNLLNELKELKKLELSQIPDLEAQKINDLLEELKKENNYHNNFELGSIYLNRKEYKKAIRYLTHAFDIAKKNRNKQRMYKALTTLSVAYSKINNQKKSLSLLKRAKKLEPEKANAYNKTGNVYDKEKKHKEATKEYLTAKKVEKKDPESYRNLANQSFIKNKPNQAIYYLKEGVKNNPDHFRTYENLGDGYIRILKYDSGIKQYEKALTKSGLTKRDKSRLYLKMSNAYEKKGNPEKTDEYLSKAQKADSDNPRVNEKLGDKEYYSGNHKSALTHYKNALQNDSKNNSLRNKYSRVLKEYKENLEKKRQERIQELEKKTSENDINPLDSNKTNQMNSTKLDTNSDENTDNNQLNEQSSSKDISNENQESNSKNSSQIQDLIQSGIKAFKQKDYPRAEEFFNRAKSIDPNNAEVSYLLGRLYQRTSRLNEAESEYREAIRKNPKDEKSYYYLGILLFKKKKYSEAKDSFRKAIQINPKNYKAYYSLGLVYDAQKSYSSAVTSYKNALKINPDLYEARYNLSISYKKWKKYNESIKNFTILAEKKPNSDIFNQIGEVYLLQNNYSNALNSFNRSLSYDSDNKNTLYNMAIVYGKLNQPEKAIETLQKIPEPQADKVYYELGKNYEKMKNIDSAISNYLKAVEKNSQYFKAYLSLGNLYKFKKNLEEAQKYYFKAYQLSPKNYEINLNMAELYYDSGRYKDAISYYENALVSRPKDTILRLAYAQNLEKAQKYHAAENQYKNVLNVNPKNKTALDKIAFLYYRKLNNSELASNYFHKLIEYYPSDPKKEEYQRILQYLNQ